MKSHNIFTGIPQNLDQELFEFLAGNDTVVIEKIISKGQKSPESGWYDQERNEWVIVLKGNAVLSFENGISVHLNEGDFINIPAHTRHRVAWTDPNDETIWLAVHY